MTVACCLPGLGLAVVVGVAATVATPLLGLDPGAPAVAGLLAMAIGCPLAKLIAVAVLRRRASCSLPVASAPVRPMAPITVGELRARSGQQSQTIAELRASLSDPSRSTL